MKSPSWLGDGGSDGRGCRKRLLGDVGLVLPDGLRGNGGINSFRGHSRADKVAAILPLHAGVDRIHISDSRGVDVGRRLAGAGGVLRLCRLDDSPQHWWLGGAGRDHAGGPETGEVPTGRRGETNPARPTCSWSHLEYSSCGWAGLDSTEDRSWHSGALWTQWL